MNIVLDTSIIVEIDRRNEEVIRLMKKLIEHDHKLVISTITVSEILTGSYLQRDFKKSVSEAKKILGQFLWIDFDSNIAEKTGQCLAYLITDDRKIEYQDVAIAATAIMNDCDYLLTLNKKDFLVFPDLKNKVYDPKELAKIIK